MPEPLSVHRVLGGGSFAEIGEPLVAVTCEARGEIAVGGDLGDLYWSGRSVSGWSGHRVGVYGLDGLDCRLVVGTRWPVNSLDFHPSLPLLAVGTGSYDGGYVFEGELLLVDLANGSVVSALEHRREVRRVRWRGDGIALELVVAPPDEDSAKKPFTHGFAVVVEREDWHCVPDRGIASRELAGPRVKAGPRPDDAEEAAREMVTALGDAREKWWSLRRQVRAVEALADGRVLAALEGTKLESWLPSGGFEWSVPDPDGARQLYVCPGQESAWVNVARPSRLIGSRWEDARSTVERLSLTDGSTLDTAEVAFPAVLTADLDGRIALRDTRQDEPKSPIVLFAPDGRESAGVVLGGYDSVNHYFPVRYSPELLFLQGRKNKYWKDKWIVSVVPPADGGEPEIRRLLLLEWDAGRHGHLYGGPAVHLAGNGDNSGGAAPWCTPVRSTIHAAGSLSTCSSSGVAFRTARRSGCSPPTTRSPHWTPTATSSSPPSPPARSSHSTRRTARCAGAPASKSTASRPSRSPSRWPAPGGCFSARRTGGSSSARPRPAERRPRLPARASSARRARRAGRAGRAIGQTIK